jgi:hypothetical protein
MFEKIELLDGALRFTPFWLFLDLLLLIHFSGSWIYSVRKTGWKIDFFYLILLECFIAPVLLMYPFNGSFQNMSTIGVNPFLQADSYIDQAFAITLLGYIGVWFGAYIISVSEVHRLCERIFSIFGPLEDCTIKNILSKKSIYFLFIVLLFLTALITALSIHHGFFLRPRVFFQMNGVQRPIYNLTISLAPILLAFLSLHFLQFREKWSKILLMLIFFMSIFYGIRSVMINSLLFYYSFSIFKNKGRFKTIRFIATIIVLILLALELEKIREGIPIFHLSSGIFSALVYGNHFSDTRDFAWVLANWDNEYLLGLGYLANLLSFIPSDLLSFRQEYSLANYTSKLIDLDLSIHNGVRPGFFGQLFFNFSFLGVFLGGIIFGMTLKFTNLKFKECILEKNNIVEAYGKTIPYFCITNLLFTHIYWTLYLFILINLATSAFRRVRMAI